MSFKELYFLTILLHLDGYGSYIEDQVPCILVGFYFWNGVRVCVGGGVHVKIHFWIAAFRISEYRMLIFVE